MIKHYSNRVCVWGTILRGTLIHIDLKQGASHYLVYWLLLAQIIPFIPWNHIFFSIELSSEGILSAQPPPPPNLPFRLSNYIPEARSGYAAWSHSGLFIVAVELEHHVIGGLKGTWGKENSHHIKKALPSTCRVVADFYFFQICECLGTKQAGQSGLFKSHKLLHRTCPGVAELVELACVCICVSVWERKRASSEVFTHHSGVNSWSPSRRHQTSSGSGALHLPRGRSPPPSCHSQTAQQQQQHLQAVNKLTTTAKKQKQNVKSVCL